MKKFAWYLDLPEGILSTEITDSEYILRNYSLKTGRACYRYSFSGSILYEDYKKIIDAFKDLGFRFFQQDYEVDTNGTCQGEMNNIVCQRSLSDRGCLSYSFSNYNDTFSIAVHLLDSPLPAPFIKFIESHIIKKQTNNVYIFVESSNGLRLNKVKNIGSPIIKENYSINVLEKFDYTSKTLLDSENRFGGLVLLTGKPGTGKSYMIRGFVHDLVADFIFVPSSMIASLSGPEIANCLIQGRKNSNFDDFVEKGEDKSYVLIMEDGDASILKRRGTSDSSISTVLNMSDGILGQILKTKFIISTNLPRNEIDSAILRPGRLNSVISFESLTRDQASLVLKKLDDSKELPSGKDFTLADIYGIVNDFSGNLLDKDEFGAYG